MSDSGIGAYGGEALEEFYTALLHDDPERLYDQAPCGYLSTTPEGLIIKVNQTFLTLTGYTRDELLGRRTFAELLTAGGRIYHETHVAPMLQMHGRARAIALDVRAADGRPLPMLVNSVLERDAFEAPVVIRTAVFDATDRREYERELLRAKQRAEESEARAGLLVRTLQQTLMPHEAPDIPLLEVDAAYRPAGDGQEIGGDFYDIFQIGDGDWMVAIGDVCGKGVEAAVVTAMTRYAVRAASVSQAPSEALATVNEVMLRHGGDRFCTAVLVHLQCKDGRWSATVSAGGHPLPYLVDADGSARTVGRPGSLLGVLARAQFHDVPVELGAGQTLLLYTDGTTEGRRGAAFFGDERLVAALRRHAGSAASLTRGVLEEVLEFQDGNPADDIALVAVRVPADPAGGSTDG